MAVLSPIITPAALAACTSSTFTNMSLGAYTGIQSTSGATPAAVNCPNGTAFTIGLDNGTGIGATATNREMTDGATALNYELFQDAGHAVNWGNVSTPSALAGTGTGSNQSFTVYPVIPAGQYVAPGTYVDTITATVADGGNVTSTFTVTALVQATCQISVTPVPFGQYSGAEVDLSGAVTVLCTNTTSWYINMDDGLNADAGSQPRMAGPGGAVLSWSKFLDAAHTQYWGNTDNSDGLGGTGNGINQTYTIYNQLFGTQYPTPGAYSDSVMVKVTY